MLRTILVTSIISFGLAAGLVNRFAALLLYVWFALFRPIEWVWIDLFQFRLSLVAGVMLVAPCVLTGVMPNLTHPLSMGTLVFGAAAAMAHFGAVDTDLSLSWLDYFMRLTLICLFIVTLVTTRRRFVLLVAVVAGSFGFHSAKAGLASLLGGGVQFYDGLAGAFIDNNGYAVGAAMILFLLIATGQNVSRRWAKAGWFLAAPLSAFLVISTFSRAGFVAVAAGVAVFVVLQKRRLRASVALCAVLAIASLVFPVPSGYGERIDTIRTYDEIGDTSAISRPHFWRVALDMVQDHPLGVGLWNYEANYNRYDFSGGEFGGNRAVHSSHFQVLSETGIIGMAAYCFMFWYAIVLLMRIRARSRAPRLPAEDGHFLWTMANALLASMAGFLAGGSFISMALNDLTWLTFALVAALDHLSAQMLDAPVVAAVGTTSRPSWPRSVPAPA